jgi:aminoglycoside 3-N-acetyltransferase
MGKPHTKDSLIADLKAAGIDSKGTLHVHSSVKSVGECENKGDTIIDAFIEYMSGGLLTFPTHTWMEVGYKVEENPQNKIYDPQINASCVGVLTNLFLKREGVVRSLHPTHSVAALGEGAVDYIDGEELTRSPCSRGGCYGKLYDLRAQILFMGCDLTANTFIHSVEEWHDIPDRLTAEPQELFVRVNGGLILCPQHRHSWSGGDISNNYGKIEGLLIENGAAAYCKIGDADCILCDAVKMADLVSELLQKNKDYFATE